MSALTKFGFLLLRILTFQFFTVLAVIISYTLKFKMAYLSTFFFDLSIGTLYTHTQIEDYLYSVWVLCIISFIIHINTSLFATKELMKRNLDYAISIWKSQILITLFMMALHLFNSPFPLSKSIFILWLFISSGFLIMAHVVLRKIQYNFLKHKNQLTHCLVIGCDDISLDITEKLIIHHTRFFHYVGTLSTEEPQDSHYYLRNIINVIGQPSQLEAIIKTKRINTIFVASPTDHGLDLNTIDRLVRDYHVEFRFIQSPVNYEHSLLQLTPFFGLLMFRYGPYVSPTFWKLKATLGWLFSLLLLILSSPVMLLVALWIKSVDAKAPVIYKQTRLGLNHRPFTIYKFRTMTQNVEADVPKWVHEHTPSSFIMGGSLIRRLSLDELPQFWNILRGDMHLIGPRPERPYFADQIEQSVPHFKLRTAVKPGITGWAQVNGRSALTAKPDQKIKYDLYYIKNWSLLLDIKILVLTFFIVIQQEEAL